MCCVPYVGTIVAGVLCVFQGFTNLCWNIPLIIGLSLNKTEVLTLTPVNIEDLQNAFLVYGVSILLVIINIQMLVFSCLLFKANHDMRTDWIGAWCIVVLVKSIINVLLGIYFIYEYGNDPTKRIAFFRLAALFSGIFFFWPFINLCLFILVFRRYREIVNSRVTVSRAVTTPHYDTEPPPYTPGTFSSRQNSSLIDSPMISGWSNQPLLSFDNTEAVAVTLNSGGNPLHLQS